MSLLEQAEVIERPELPDLISHLGDTNLQTKIDLYSLAEFLDVPSADYNDEKTAQKISAIYEWAKTRGGVEAVKELRMRMPVSDSVNDLEKVYAYIRLEQDIAKHRKILGTLMKHRTKLL